MEVLEERVSQTESRLDRLERLVEMTTKNVAALSSEMREFKGEMQTFKEEMQDFKEEMQEFKGEMLEFKEEIKEWCKKIDERMRQTEADAKKREKEWHEWHEKTDKQMKEYKKEQDRHNKKMEELSAKFGTMVEDFVIPNIPRIGEEELGLGEMIHCFPRVESKNKKKHKKEFDVVAVFPHYILLNETKSKARPEYVSEFIQFLKSGEFWEYFPEYEGKKLVPIFASFYIPEEIVCQLTKNQIYAMVLGEETMGIINKKEIMEL